MREKRSWMVIAAGAAVLAAALVLFPVRHVSAAGPRWGANYFPNVELTTQDGQKVHFYDDLLKDKIVVIDLIYTHCVDACPLETARLAQVQKVLGNRMGKDIFFYSISIDPKRDTPEVLKAYAEKFHAGPGWLFLTGKPDDIELISKKIGLYSDPDPGNRDGHTTDLMVGNVPAGQWMRNVATDNPRYLATMIENLVGGWRTAHQTDTGMSYAQAGKFKTAEKGQYLFQIRCSACHTIGHGVRVGPDLLGVTNTRQREWLLRFIREPDVMLQDKDPIAMALFKEYKGVQMPNMRLGPGDVLWIVNFLKKQDAAADQKEAVAARPLDKGAGTQPQQ